jgi:hypothetical protein
VNVFDGGLHILPGVNSLESAKWDAIKNHPQVLKRIEDGIYEVLSQGDEQTNDGNNENLANFKSPKAIQIVAATFDSSLLKTWEAAEKRKEVKMIIQAQLKKLESPETKPDTSSIQGK